MSRIGTSIGYELGIDQGLVERILEKLGRETPEPTVEGRGRLYAARCRRVPFDNVRKLIHVRAGDRKPLPGDTPEDFFGGWLVHGCGGTYWPATARSMHCSNR